jgi:phosphatidylserine/phosphatidylglycerophosphate/cardiolipin synthase-like enzyme
MNDDSPNYPTSITHTCKTKATSGSHHKMVQPIMNLFLGNFMEHFLFKPTSTWWTFFKMWKQMKTILVNNISLIIRANKYISIWTNVGFHCFKEPMVLGFFPFNLMEPLNKGLIFFVLCKNLYVRLWVDFL